LVDWECNKAGGEVIEQLIRPTGLLDPTIEVVPARIQVDHALGAIRDRVALGDRVLVTTLTKRMAVELTDFLTEHGVRARYLHADIDTIERTEILRELRLGSFDVLVGINLLREGLDLPEVSLVLILDADKEGFLRNERSLVQTIGRAARNAEGHVVLYGDVVTDSMRRAIDETRRRRTAQEAHNRVHGIVPTTIRREVGESLASVLGLDDATPSARGKRGRTEVARAAPQPQVEVRAESLPALLEALRKEMKAAAKALEFEQAAGLRDRIRLLEQRLLEGSGDGPADQTVPA
jgi:excinuclease ABC subunit B